MTTKLLHLCICEHIKGMHTFLETVTDAKSLGGGGSFKAYKCNGVIVKKRKYLEDKISECPCKSYQETPFSMGGK